MAAARELTPPERAYLAQQAQRELCRRSFAEFLRYVHVRTDDPLNPEVVPLNPWPFQVERAEAWAAGASEVVLKERQLGFSSALVAPYMLWRAMYHGWTCGYWSKGELEAKEELDRVEVIYEHLPAWLRVSGSIGAEVATFSSGGRILAYPSTPSAGVSFTFQLAVMDEAAFHPYGAQNYAAIQPAVSRGQVLILSTADPRLGPHGFFHDMYWASKRGETPYAALFVARCRPDRDAVWYALARKAYAGNEEAFNAFYPETDAEAFSGRSGLVYPTMPVVVSADPLPWAQWSYRYAGVDLGGGDPTVVVPVGVGPTRTLHQPGEAYWREPVTVTAVGEYLWEWHRVARFDRIYCPPEAANVIEELRAAGLPAYAADNRRDGILLMRAVYEQRRMTVHESCRDSLAEFAGYRWANRTDPNSKERYATSTPVDNHGDGHDARRYACIPYLRAENRAEPGPVAIEVQTTGAPAYVSAWKRRKPQEPPAGSGAVKVPRVR